jgi:hypothetical protein
MKVTLPGRARPDKVASKDDTRPAMTHLFLRLRRAGKKGTGKVIGGMIEATDSYKLVRLPVEFDDTDEPTEGFLPAAMFTGKQVIAMTVRNGEVAVTNTDGVRTLERPDMNGRTYPDVDKLLDPILENMGPLRIGLNARYLYELAQAMGDDTVVLGFSRHGRGSFNNLRPMLVLPGTSSTTTERDGPLGVLMPIRLKGD